MADTKISALTGASTPLAGTEVVPLVQSSTTKKVSVDDLTAGRAVSAASLSTTGSVGIGTNSPSKKLSVSTSANYDGIYVINSSTNTAARIIMENDASKALQLDMGASGQPSYGPFDANTATIISAGANLNIGTDSATILGFYTNLSERARITSGGDFQVSTGNVVIGTAGKGIDFSASSHAAGMTSELLNDYEEGTFTPYFVSWNGSNPTISSYSTQAGFYVKVGRMVYVNIRLSCSGSISGGTGYISITGLPFTTETSTSNYQGLNIFQYEYMPDTGLGGATQLTIRLFESGVGGIVVGNKVGTTAYGDVIPWTSVSGSLTLFVNGCYESAS